MRPAHYHHFSNRLKEPVDELPLKSSLSLKRGGNTPTFARNSTATVFGFSSSAVSSDTQLMLTADSNEIRFDGARRESSGVFDEKYLDGIPISENTLKGYVAEGGRTTLVTYNEDFSNAVWTKINSTITADAEVAPRGATTAEKFIVNNASTGFLYRYFVSLSGTYTQSIYVKKANLDYAYIWLNDGAGFGYTVEVNLVTGANRNTYSNPSGQYGSFSYLVTSVGNGWYRVQMTATLLTATIIQLRVYNSNIAWTNESFGTAAYTGNGTSGIYLWGAQLEQAAFASSYIPTTSASVARLADVLSKTFYKVNNKKLSISLEYNSYHAPSGTAFLWGSYVDASNYVAILHDGTNLIARKRVSGSNTDAVIANAFAINTFYKVLAVFTDKKCSIYLNGIKGTDAFSLSDLPLAAGYEIGSDGNGSGQCFMNIRNHKIFDYDLTDIQAMRLQ